MLLRNKEDSSVITVPFIPNSRKVETYFCSNPQCEYHVDIRKLLAVKSFRHKHRDNFYLCDTCHNAVELEKKLQNQRRIDIINRQLNGHFAYVKSNLRQSLEG